MCFNIFYCIRWSQCNRCAWKKLRSTKNCTRPPLLHRFRIFQFRAIDFLNLKPVSRNHPNCFTDGLLGLLQQSKMVSSTEMKAGRILYELSALFSNVCYRFLRQSHICCIYIWLSHLKQPMYAQVMWSFYVTWPKPFWGLAVHRIQQIMYAFQQ